MKYKHSWTQKIMNKQSLTTILLTVLMSMAGAKAFAYDIAVANADGVTIYYNYINNGVDLEVTEGNYSGKLKIPEEVIYRDRTRKVTAIGEYAFYECTSLTSVSIPNSVTFIKSQAFNGCNGLTSITIPSSVTSVGGNAFKDCIGLTSVHISDLEAWCRINFSDGLTNPLLYAHHLYLNGKEIKDLVIPNSVTAIGGEAFASCSNLTSVTIPHSVTTIGRAAFYECSNLTSVTIPSSVTSIGVMAFYGCNNLTSVFLLTAYPFEIAGKASDSRTFDLDVFNNSTLYVPTGTIDKYKATYGWKDFLFIEEISWIEGGQCGDKVYYSYDKTTHTLTISGKGPMWSDYTELFSWFRYKDDIQHVIIESGVTSIGDFAFVFCNNLTSVTIPNSVTSIDEDAFAECSGLTSIYIPNSVTYIGQCAFDGCSGLTSLSIPNDVTYIGDYAFRRCSGLKSILVESGNPNYDSRNNCNAIIETSSNSLIVGCMNTIIPNNVTSIGEYAFDGCSGLTTIYIPNGVTSIGDCAFLGCSGLTSLSIPNSVTSIELTFINCTGLTYIVIPNSMTFIGVRVFDGCSSLTDYYIWSDKVPSTDSKSFSGANIENATLHVPAASVEIYKQTYPWSGFGRIVPLTDEDPTSMKGILQSDHLNGEYYDLSGRKVNNPKKGLYINNGRKVIMK